MLFSTTSIMWGKLCFCSFMSFQHRSWRNLASYVFWQPTSIFHPKTTGVVPGGTYSEIRFATSLFVLFSYMISKHFVKGVPQLWFSFQFTLVRDNNNTNDKISFMNEYLLYGRHCAKHIACIISCIRERRFESLFVRWRRWDVKRINNLP